MVVHVCVFDHQGRLLIQQRTPEKILWPDRWDVSIGGGVDAGETSRQAAEREFREELGYPLDLAGSRPFVTVNFPAGFDDFTSRSGTWTWGADAPEGGGPGGPLGHSEEVLALVESGAFIPYPKSFVEYLFDTRETFGFPGK